MEVSPDNFMMRNTVHGAGGFFEQRKLKINKKIPDSQIIEKFNPVPNTVKRTTQKASLDNRLPIQPSYPTNQ